VINAGVAGYGTVQEYLYLLTAGLAHNPDVVLVMLFENDLTDNCMSVYPGLGPRPYAAISDGAVRIVREPDREAFAKYALPVPFADTLIHYSLLFYILNAHVYQPLRADHLQALVRADHKRADRCGRDQVLFGLLDDIVERLSARGIQFGLVLIPTHEQAQRGSAPWMQPILDYCQQKRIAHLSLLPRLSRAMPTAQPYFADDIHWNRSGHRLAAEEIAGFLGSLTAAAAATPAAGER
jgi:hypothetical protein